MNDPDVIKLLTEIRDLSREHINEYRDYLARHEKLAAQQQARFTKAMRVVMVIVLLIGVALGSLLGMSMMRLAACGAWSG